MALGKIKNGTYGKYYEFRQDGKIKRLALKNQGYNLIEEQIDTLIETGHLDFIGEDGEVIRATLDSFYNKKYKKDSLTIKYSGGSSSDGVIDKENDIIKILEKQDEIIGLYCENNNFYGDRKTETLLKTLGLSTKYPRCVAVETEVPTVTKVIIFYGYPRNYADTEKQYLILYLKTLRTHSGYKSDRQLITEAQYREAIAEYEEQKRLKEKELAEAESLYNECILKGIEWIKGIKEELFDGDSPISDKKEVLNKLEPIISAITPTDMVNGISNPPQPLSIIADPEYYAWHKIYNRDPEGDLERMKTATLKWLRKYYDYYRIANVRNELNEEVKKDGIENVVNGIDINSALDLGRFKELKKILKKHKENAVKAIIYNSYIDETNPDALKEKILNMLKIYYEFFNITGKNIKAVAKFVANNKLSDYYDKVLEYDEAVEVLMKEGDSALKKRVLTGIVGTSRVSILGTDSSYYFERRTRVKDGVIVHDPMRLIDELRKLISLYNASSDVAILHNIELDETGDVFTYQFYTYSEDSSGKDFDGRRLQYMTRLYNERHDPKIYFDYDV